MTLTLASTSPFRKALLENAGFRIETCAPGVDESTVKSAGNDPKKIAETLATLKAEAGKGKTNNPWIVGSDQVAALGDIIFDKPGTTEKAVATLKQLQGKTHQLITSVHLITPEKSVTWSNITSLTMNPLNEQEIQNYIQIDQPLGCAGSYMLEKTGVRLFSAIDSTDFTAIQGLPMIELCNQLRACGFDWD